MFHYWNNDIAAASRGTLQEFKSIWNEMMKLIFCKSEESWQDCNIMGLLYPSNAMPQFKFRSLCQKIKWRKSAFSLAFIRFISDSNINQINIFFQVLWLLLYLEVSRTSAEEYEPRSTTRRIGSRQKCLLKTHKNSGRQTNPKGLGENKVVKNNRLGLDYNWPHKNARWVGLELPNNLVGSKGRGPE